MLFFTGSAPSPEPGSQRPLSRELFFDALARERRRADRFDESLALVLISHPARLSKALPWNRVVDAVSHPQIDPDVVGWFRRDSVLGLVRTLGNGATPEDAGTTMAATVRRELARELGPVVAGSCSVRSEVYVPAGVMPAATFAPARRRQRLKSAASDTVKRALDIVGSLSLLIALAPVFLIAAVLVKRDSRGPVFFRQERIGRGGRPFTMLKFRTMHVDADQKVHEQHVASLMAASGAAGAPGVAWSKKTDDPRVTRVGDRLRRSSIDELPQFWNVLRGDMSLVGPRPAIAYEVDRYKRWQRRRVLEVKPGVSGLWQVKGRSSTTFEEMVRLDIQYAQTCSLWLDLKILLATPRVVLSGKGAL